MAAKKKRTSRPPGYPEKEAAIVFCVAALAAAAMVFSSPGTLPDLGIVFLAALVFGTVLGTDFGLPGEDELDLAPVLARVVDHLEDFVLIIARPRRPVYANRDPIPYRFNFDENESDSCFRCAWGTGEPCPVCKIKRVFETGESERLTKIDPENGEFLEIVIKPLPVEDGRSPLVMAQVRDISERIAADRERAERLHFLRALVDTIPSPIYYKDRDCRYLGVNRAYEEIMGVKGEDIMGRDVTAVAEDDLAAIYSEKDKELLELGGTQVYESKVRNSAGELRDVVFNKAVFHDNNGDVAGIVGFFNDVTDQKRSEREIGKRLDLERLVASISSRFINLPPDRVDEGIDAALAEVGEFAGADRSYVMRFNDDMTLIDNTHEWCAPGVEPMIDSLQGTPAADVPWWMTKLLAFEPIHVGSLGDLPPEAGNEKRMLQEQDIKSLVVAPMSYQGKLTGFTGFDFVRTGRRWPDADLNILETISGIFVSALERKRTGERLLLRDERYALATEAGKVGVWDWNVAAGEFYLDPVVKSLLGYEDHEIPNDLEQWSEHIHPEDKEAVMAAAEDHMEGRTEAYVFEHRMVHKDGAERWILVQGRAVRDEEGRVVRMAGTDMDITALKQAEEEVRLSRERYLLATRAGRVGVWDWDLGADLIHIDSVVKGMFGFKEDADPVSVRDCIDYMHPDDREQSLGAMRSFMESGGAEMSLMTRARDRSGDIRWVEIRGSAFRDGGGRVRRMVGTIVDITETMNAIEALRDNEERMRLLVRNLPVMVSALDEENGSVIIWNRECERVTGYAMDEILSTPDIGARMFPKGVDLGRVREWFLGDGARDDQIEIELRSKDGEYRVVSCSNVSIRHPIPGWGAWAVGIDITDARRAEAERAKMEERMRHAQKLESLGILAGGVAHDFNNLLTTILGNSELAMAAVPKSSPVNMELAGVRKAALKAADLCRQMLDYSGKGKLLSSPQDLNAIVGDVADLLRVSISKRIALNFDFEKDLPPIMADPSQVQQVVMNLIVNASEAIGGEPGVIHAETSTVKYGEAWLKRAYLNDELAEGTYVMLRVSDTGAGMDEETMSRIFDPFFTTKFTGRGLGLASVIGIVRGHGGALMVESEPGNGAEFTVLFPVMEGCETAGADQGADGGEWRGGGLALIVEDEEMIRSTARRVMGYLGFETIEAPDGPEAIDIVKDRAEELAVVLLDLTMPKMSGAETLGEIMKIAPGLPVVIVSGQHKKAEAEGLLEKGASRFLPKPFSIESLKEAVKSAIGED